MGITLAFHVSLTLFAVRQKQPDIHKTGIFFSIVFILLANAWVLMIFAKLLFRDTVSIKTFLFSTLNTQTGMWMFLAEKMTELFGWIRTYLEAGSL